jgi:hypothetical protein
MIVLPNIDGKIWNLEQKILDIVDCVINQRPLHISLNNEGPDANELGLYSLLDVICNQYNYPKQNVTILTNNLLESHSEYCIRKAAPFHFVTSAQQFALEHEFPTKTFNKDFKHFGLFIGRSNWLRLWLASYMYNYYRNLTKMTFHYNPNLDFHQDHLGLDDLIRFRPDLIANLDPLQLIANSPIIDQAVEAYPIITPAHFNISNVYHCFFLEVVCETYSRGTSFFPTEKTWRPIATRTPFIVQGPKDYIKNLHRLGFKTFSNWFDESHSQDEYNYQPIGICATLDRLATYSISELEGIYIDMNDTLEHNYQNLMLLTNTKVTEMFK